MKNLGSTYASVIALALVSLVHTGAAQSNVFLPVYQVVQAGALAPQAAMLANLLNIPTNLLTVSNGAVSYLDTTNYLAVPTIPITDPAVISNLLTDTVNCYPAIPISLEEIDFTSLSNLTVLNTNMALTLISNALAGSGLTPPFGTPAIAHTVFTLYYTNLNNDVISNAQYLDTQVNYQFNLTNGYPLTGPGAQAQITYGATGNVSRLFYSVNQLTPGPLVQIISASEASNRAAQFYPANAQIDAKLVYWCPALEASTITNILPWYVCGGTIDVTNSITGDVETTSLLTKLVPATDDTNFIPVLNFSASAPGSTQVVASVSVTGGQPPYRYLWGGSSLLTSSNTQASVNYTPVFRATPPDLEIISVSSSNTVSVAWPQPSQGFVLESNIGLGTNAWIQIANPAQTNNGLEIVTVQVNPADATFFRLRLLNQLPQAESIGVMVIDANGVTVQAGQTLSVQAAPYIVPAINDSVSRQALLWGLEGPFDTVAGQPFTTDYRNQWVNGMGDPAHGGGVQEFVLINDLSWKADFLEFPPATHPGVMDRANIVIYIGHGQPSSFAFSDNNTSPGPRPEALWYPAKEQLLCMDATACWGDRVQNWLCMLSCDVLFKDWVDNSHGGVIVQPWNRWGQYFNGLHSMLGFVSPANSMGGFPQDFVSNILTGTKPASLTQGWFDAASKNGTGSPAALGPFGGRGGLTFNDHYWGKGTVGTSIKAPINGWWFMQ